MNDPRIGDTVHYTSHGTPLRPDGTRAYYPACRAAIITDTNLDSAEHDDGTIRVHVFSLNGQHDDTVARDPGHGWEDFTPGTWHHIH